MMSSATAPQESPRPAEPPATGDAGVIAKLLPYLWEYRGRVFLALAFLITAKFANLAVPLLMKAIVDGLSGPKAVLAVPLALLAAYGILRLSSTLFNELRDVVFVKVAQRAMRRVALEVFEHMHSLSLRFHLERQTGGLTRDIERGTRGISTLLNFMVFSVLPTFFEIALVTGFLIARFDVWFGVITVGALVLYIAATFLISERRIHHRRTMNEMDSKANTRAIDSLINYETVKYFGNESWEARRYDENLSRYESAVVTSETSLGFLNVVQAAIIALAVSLLMWRAADGIVNGPLTLGDLVMVNALLIQLYIPLNFLGVLYREIKQSLTDMEKMFRLLSVNREVEDKPGAPALAVKGAAIRFEAVDFSYDGRRTILSGVDFEVPAGKTVAVVGASGSGKSTLGRLLFRFYDVQAGRITIDGQDIRDVTQLSVRSAIGIVPQDTVLFNDSIYYNIAYGRPGAPREEVVEAARMAHILEFIESLPDKWETSVGERGLKLSGGEKQRVSIARTLLKDPPVMIFDEATSALDSRTEKAIQAEFAEISRNRTTLMIAHRLSTIVDADQILVMDAGRIVERGSFRELIAQEGRFAEMWRLQQQEEAEGDAEIDIGKGEGMRIRGNGGAGTVRPRRPGAGRRRGLRRAGARRAGGRRGREERGAAGLGCRGGTGTVPDRVRRDAHAVRSGARPAPTSPRRAWTPTRRSSGSSTARPRGSSRRRGCAAGTRCASPRSTRATEGPARARSSSAARRSSRARRAGAQPPRCARSAPVSSRGASVVIAWPASSATNFAPGISFASACPALSGVIASRRPATTSVGTLSARMAAIEGA